MPPEDTNVNPPPNDGSTNSNTNHPPASYESFEKYLETVDPSIKELYEKHNSGLLNSVKATRDERDNFRKELNELKKTAEKGSDLEKKVTSLQDQLDANERKLAFLEDASRPDVECKNPKAALAIAIADDLFTRTGAPDWAAIKAAAPELFGKVIPPSNSSEGRNNSVPSANINDAIRKMAGR